MRKCESLDFGQMAKTRIKVTNLLLFICHFFVNLIVFNVLQSLNSAVVLLGIHFVELVLLSDHLLGMKVLLPDLLSLLDLFFFYFYLLHVFFFCAPALLLIILLDCVQSFSVFVNQLFQLMLKLLLVILEPLFQLLFTSYNLSKLIFLVFLDKFFSQPLLLRPSLIFDSLSLLGCKYNIVLHLLGSLVEFLFHLLVQHLSLN